MPFSCDTCNRIFKDARKKKSHICYKLKAIDSTLGIKRKTVSPDSDLLTNSISTTSTSSSFSSPSPSPSLSLPSSSYTIRCPLCTDTFKFKNDLCVHLRYVHPG